MNSMGVPYDRQPDGYLETGGRRVASFSQQEDSGTIDHETVRSFGEEWDRFDAFCEDEVESIAAGYFDVVQDGMIGSGSVALDIGCGGGRWAQYLSRRVGFVEAVDPSTAVVQAAARLDGMTNVRVTQASVAGLPFPDNSFDFVMCLGVLHHLPDTERALAMCARKLKPGGHLLVYVYYALDQRGLLYRMVWRASDLLRKLICKLPSAAKRLVCDVIAFSVYLPLVVFGRLLKRFGILPSLRRRLPLAYYSDKSFYVMRNDALDRFGTPLERRFTRDEIRGMMERSGLADTTFSERAPYWHAVGRRA